MKKYLLLAVALAAFVLLYQWADSHIAVTEKWIQEKYSVYTGYGMKTENRKAVLVSSFQMEKRVMEMEEAKKLALKKQEEEQKQDAFLNACIQEMTLEEKISQLMILTNERDIAEENLRKEQPGGIILFDADFNGKTIDEITKRIDLLQSYMKYPLFVGVDEEGGEVSRVDGLLNKEISEFASARQLGNTADWNALTDETTRKARLLASMGINLNFDPVADIVTEKNAYMYERSAGSDAKTVSAYVAAVLQAMEHENIMGCLKHFPGYGNNGNTHRGYIMDKRKLQSYRESDFIPFQTGIENGADMIMVSHLVMGAVDRKNPASLSVKVHELLRDELAFDGVIIADDLNMQAVLSHMTLEEASGKAIAAGNDMIFSADFAVSQKGILDAIEEGTVTKEQIDISTKRVLRMKLEHNLLTME
ncbi:MAG: beta-hexosaminidase [Lachnospiraceae bacterium]|nr:beta-hexosaminidase [Lachnospiraceae bacterium]